MRGRALSALIALGGQLKGRHVTSNQHVVQRLPIVRLKETHDIGPPARAALPGKKRELAEAAGSAGWAKAAAASDAEVAAKAADGAVAEQIAKAGEPVEVDGSAAAGAAGGRVAEVAAGGRNGDWRAEVAC